MHIARLIMLQFYAAPLASKLLADPSNAVLLISQLNGP